MPVSLSCRGQRPTGAGSNFKPYYARALIEDRYTAELRTYPEDPPSELFVKFEVELIGNQMPIAEKICRMKPPEGDRSTYWLIKPLRCWASRLIEAPLTTAQSESVYDPEEEDE